MENIFERLYKPDVLSCLADLSNDEVFTPPEVANKMLDLLPQELFQNKETKILDPACKSGVLLREAAKRFIAGERDQFDTLEECLDWIFKNQLYGIAITELTSLLSRRSVYCSKYPASPFSVVNFGSDNVQGNIMYHRIQHSWVGVGDDKKCSWCGASAKEYKRADDLETHAYEWIHTVKPEDIWNMKFDVIVSNPPYQLSDGGFGKSAKPIYQLFVNQSKKLNPRYMTMIIPSRWFSGGRGLDDFRAEMLNDQRIRKLIDFESFKDVFPGVDLAGGACYFLWDRDHSGLCEITNKANDKADIVAERSLNEFDVFIRSNKAVSIIHKICTEHTGAFMDKTVSPSKPFGLRTFYEPKDSGIPCQFIQKIGLKYAAPEDVTDNLGILDKWKFIAPRSPIAGQTDFSKPVGFYYDGNTRILPPGTCCTESFIVLFTADTREEVESFKTYMFTKTARYLLLQCVVSQDVTREKFKFVPALPKYDGVYNDDRLRRMWHITEDEWTLIDSKISAIGETDVDTEG